MATVRRASVRDAQSISDLIGLYVADGTLLPRTPEFIAERVIDFLVSEEDGRVVGCVHLDEYSPSLVEVRSLAVDPAYQRRGIGIALVEAAEELARRREYTTVFAVSSNEEFFRARGYDIRHIPELDRERSEVSRYKGVYAKDLGALTPASQSL
ncbi:MAG TPA: GNAT family N-acetyltransferase [Gemmatimonadaceae bacterium]|nr:GNAT family N-acetyltransferase [Gemmatimonadaceae bacterium]